MVAREGKHGRSRCWTGRPGRDGAARGQRATHLSGAVPRTSGHCVDGPRAASPGSAFSGHICQAAAGHSSCSVGGASNFFFFFFFYN